LEQKFGKENVYILWLDLSPEQTIVRNTYRRTCELMRHPILYIPENLNLKRCPLDGSRLMRRDDDHDIEVIKVRLKEYEHRTFPLIDYFRERGYAIKQINADQYVENVLKDILDALGDRFKDYEL
jgi:adenylate kinase family enzyme